MAKSSAKQTAAKAKFLAMIAAKKGKGKVASKANSGNAAKLAQFQKLAAMKKKGK